MLLLLYVYDLFATGLDVLISHTKRNLAAKFEGIGYDALFYKHGGVVECRWNLPWTREVCCRDPEEIWDDGLQGISHTYGIKTEAIKCFFI